MPRGSCLAARRRDVTVASVAAISSRYSLVLLALPRAYRIANARFLASRRWLRQGTASPPGRALACSSRRTITRTESHSRLLSSRTTVPDSTFSCLALCRRARLILSHVSARIALTVLCSTDFFGQADSGNLAKARNEAESSR